MKRPALFALLALAAAVPASAFDLDDLMRQLAARGDAAASFVEEQRLATLDAPLRSTGELLFRSSGALEKRTLTPRAELLTYADGTAWTQRGSRRQRLDLQRYPQILPLIESIRATLAGDRKVLDELFEIELTGSEMQWKLRLTPREARARELFREIRLSGSNADVLSLDVERRNGDRSVTTMTPHAVP